MPEIRRLVAGEEAMVDAFLTPYTASSMFLRSNMRRTGLDYKNEPFHGVYLGAFADGALRGVIAHFWNGNVMMQAPQDVADMARAIIAESALLLKGLLGPFDQTQICLDTWGLAKDGWQMSQRELLFDLQLADMILPQDLVSGKLVVRRSQEGNLKQLLDWHVDYDREALGEPDSEAIRAENLESLKRAHSQGHQFVLEKEGALVAMCYFNAVLDDIRQVGGVYTPPALRGQGYARAVVAGALRIGQGEGATKSILFTGDDNIAAQTPYRAIGFREIGDFYIGLFGLDARPLIALSLPGRANDRTVEPQL